MSLFLSLIKSKKFFDVMMSLDKLLSFGFHNFT